MLNPGKMRSYVPVRALTMRVLYLYCHPLPESFHAAIRARGARGAGGRAGHEVDLLDLYAEKFDPVMSEAARRDYHDTSRESGGAGELRARACARPTRSSCQFPVWSFGMPAMLKGYFDRMLMPGVGVRSVDPAHAKPMLGNLRRIAGITTYGRPWMRRIRRWRSAAQDGQALFAVVCQW